ncbi:MAG: right-handed parallel beta-helix repeat-containing protein, partial [Cyanobacteria bacterium P01_A01_bin.83]
MLVDNKSKTNRNSSLLNQTKTINVDADFRGDLAAAIASAKDGSIVELGNSTYYTDGILIDKDITIRGQKGSRIHGEGTSKSIFYLNSDATGATIENVEITDGNNGIFVQDAADVTLKNLEIYNIGIEETIRDGSNNTGVILDRAEGFKLVNSKIHDIGKKAVGVSNTDGGLVSNLTIHDVNIDAQHAHSHDAGGIKLFNTNDIIIKGNYLESINAIAIWNDITN